MLDSKYVLSLMTEAAQVVAENPPGSTVSSMISGTVSGTVSGTAADEARWGRVAARVLYRLAQYADTLYRGLVAARSTPEYEIETQVIAVGVMLCIVLPCIGPLCS